MSDQIFWYLTRSSALVAWVAAAGSVLVGVTTTARLLGRRPTVPWLVDLHRMLSAMASIFVLIHMATLWFDGFVQFRWADLLVPGVASVAGLSRLSLAAGVVAAWLLAAVELSSLLRGRLPESAWRAIHYGSYGTMVLGTVHAVLAGSDVTNPVVAAVGVSLVTALVFAVAARVSRARRQRREAEAAAEPRPAGGRSTGQAPPLGGDPYWGPPIRPSRSGTRPRAAHRRGPPAAHG
jgi:DMSO/TMAO reductase YedYZ heme-binding membrane subunit